ncbi:MAG: hypothetical protein ABSG87_01750 [Verrucomicrobiota bacterium]
MKSFRNTVLVFAAVATMAGFARAQILIDIGTANPIPGPNDISQLSTNGNQRLTGSFNYYTDNSIPPGQTFTTGTNPVILTSASFKTGTSPLDSGSGGLGPQAYQLRIFSVSSGTVAALIDSYTSSSSFSYADGDWLQWSNLAVPLATNTTYAYTFHRVSNGWDGLAVSTNLISGGQAALIPSAGGTVTYDSPAFDAVFDIGLTTNTSQLLGGTPVVTPENIIYLGSPITLLSSAVGTPPLYYQWQMIGGSGTLTNIPNATNSSVIVTPPNAGTFKFDVIVTNSSGSVTSSVASVTVLPPVNVGVNASQPMATMPLQGLGVCTAVFDNSLINYPSIATQLKAAGISAVRYPGGSFSDVYCWTNNTGIDGAYVNSSDSFSNLMNDIVNPAGAHAIITVNYGSNPSNTGGGDTNVAAAWVNYANNVKHWGVKYWEIGNEIGGNGYYGTNQDWEYDLHYPETNPAARVGQPALSPAAYGTNSFQFISAMKAQDPTILCGVGFDPGNNAYNTPLLQAVGTNVDFVIIHWYPGGNTAATLAASTGIVATVTSTFTELTNTVGAAHASQMKIAITETGAGGATGAPVALYTADNYLTWIENGIVNVDYQILHTDMLSNSQTPGHAYYGAQMSHLLANVGDTFLTTTSALSELRVHATARQDGKTGVMFVNMDPVLAISASVNITGPTLASSGTWYQFGLTNFIGTNDFPSYPVSSNTVSGLGNQFTVLVPPYTIVDLLIPPVPTNTPPVLAPIGNQTVNVGQTIAFTATATATDTNQPPPTLTFALSSSLTNAMLTQIDNNDANFSWRPQVTQAGTTNLFMLMVADNGTPSLSATQSFTVTVNPLILPSLTALAVNNGQFSFQISGATGPDYAVETSTNLLDWSTVFITNSPAMPFLWVDTNSAALPMQFYRVQIGPPLP